MAGLLSAVPTASAQTLVYASTSAKTLTDYRAQIPTITAEELTKAKTGIEIKIHYDGELVNAAEMWRAVTGGAADIVSVYLPTALGAPPEVLFYGLPALLGSSSDAEKLMTSPAFKRLGEVLKSNGAVLLGGYWDRLSIGSAGDCMTRPKDFDRAAVRSPGKAYETLLNAQGAVSVPMVSQEVPRALKTGAIDAVMTVPLAITAGNGHKHLKCTTDPSAAVPGMVFVSTIMSAKAYDALPAERQKAVLEAGRNMSARIQAEATKSTAGVAEALRKDGLKMVALTEEDVAAWRAAAERTAWADFRKISPAADEIMTAAMAAVARN